MAAAKYASSSGFANSICRLWTPLETPQATCTQALVLRKRHPQSFLRNGIIPFMSKPAEALNLLKAGLSPGEIAREQGVTLNKILGYLNQAVGRGMLHRSDILFSIPPDRRKNPTNAADQEVVRLYATTSVALGDMYENLRSIEVALHQGIRNALETHFGAGEMGWWREGVPLEIRQKLHARREEDPEPSDPYAYSDLIDLKQIMDKRWKIVCIILPPKARSDKQSLLSSLTRLNRIRNKVMHPVRSDTPSEDDFQFVREIKQVFAID